MREYFILNGVDSRDFGVYISGQGTFSAPQKAYTFYNIPGRNGALLGNEHRLENINVRYEAFIYTDFDNQLAAFRSFLLSIDGYAKLSDSYHPDEYRYAVYQGPFEPTVEQTNDAGKFTITFSCKPQRYLLSGDASYYWVPGGSQELSGSELNVFGNKLDPTKLTWTHFYSNGEKIRYYKQGSQYIVDYISTTPNNPHASFQVTDVGMKFDDTLVYSASFASYPMVKGEINLITGAGQVQGKSVSMPTTGWTYTNGLFRHSFSYSQLFGCSHYALADNSDLLALSSVQFAIYTDGSYIYIKDSRYSAANAFQSWLSSAGVTMDVALSSAQSFSVTPYVPDYPSGYVQISGTHVGDGFKTAYTASDSMSNPTDFPASPLIRAYGNGVFMMDGVTITITGATSYTDIDCDLMDCYEGTTNRNNDVSFSTYDFPKLRPGDNAVSIVSGITALEIIPRWWRV